MKVNTEIELKFLVPADSRARLAAEMARHTASVERSRLAAQYLDTPDRQLAQSGLSWRLRREGRRWVQTLKADGPHALERFEHEVIRPDASHDASLHAGTPAGDRLLALLRRAHANGSGPAVRFQTEVRRTSRRIRTGGAAVDVAFDEGRFLSGDKTLRICEVEFELSSGSVLAMLALAERWRKRFGLVYDPRSKAERGDQWADGLASPPVRRAAPVTYAKDTSPLQAYGAVVDECLAQITRNAIGLVDGNLAQRTEHVHQLRVGIRRLRSALRSFDGWVPAPPDALVDEMRALFATLGHARDSDVMDSGVVAELATVGAPSLTLAPAPAAPDMVAAVGATETQRTILAWLTWRVALVAPCNAPPDMAPNGRDGHPLPETDAAVDQGQSAAPQAEEKATRPLWRSAERRLRKWHLRVVDAARDFDALEEEAIHMLRKRIKRLRYAVEFFTPLLRAGSVRRYLRALAALQDRMGALNDLFVARAHYQALVASDAAAWFALGWLAARIAEARATAKPALARLAKTDPPTA